MIVLFLPEEMLDCFRERVTPEDFAGERIRRVRVVGEADFLTSVAQRFFPGAGIVEEGAEAVVIAMSGGPTGPRLRALLGRARHKLLVPSPDYVYRLGMRRGPGATFWALVDRGLFSPLALLWLLVCSLARRGKRPRRER